MCYCIVKWREVPNIKECESVNLDPQIIERFERRITRLLKDMYKYNLYIFCGSSGSIRYYNDDGKLPLIVGDWEGNNHDGGCGAYCEDEEGFLRGE